MYNLVLAGFKDIEKVMSSKLYVISGRKYLFQLQYLFMSNIKKPPGTGGLL
jgi:hypothetical protein